MVKENSVEKESQSLLVRQRETLGKTGSHTSSIRARVETSLRSESYVKNTQPYKVSRREDLVNSNWIQTGCLDMVDMADDKPTCVCTPQGVRIYHGRWSIIHLAITARFRDPLNTHHPN